MADDWSSPTPGWRVLGWVDGWVVKQCVDPLSESIPKNWLHSVYARRERPASWCHVRGYVGLGFEGPGKSIPPETLAKINALVDLFGGDDEKI